MSRMAPISSLKTAKLSYQLFFHHYQGGLKRKIVSNVSNETDIKNYVEVGYGNHRYQNILICTFSSENFDIILAYGNALVIFLSSKSSTRLGRHSHIDFIVKNIQQP